MSVIDAVQQRADVAGTERVPAGVALRPYRRADREQVRDICCRTAFRNLGVRALVDDPELFADYWSLYYTDHEPASLLVAERGDRIVGYLMGCTDTRRFRRVMARQIVPQVLAQLVSRGVRGQYRDQPHAGRFFRWLALRAWREEPAIDIHAYRAHYHANVTREGTGSGLYTSLALRFLDRVDDEGITGVHGQVLDARDDGVWARMVGAFEKECPGALVRHWEHASTIGADVLDSGKPLVNRAYGSSVEIFRRFLRFANRRYAI